VSIWVSQLGTEGLIKPKFHYADFHRNFPAEKVVDTNHKSCRHKPSRHVEMFVAKSVDFADFVAKSA